MRKCQVRLNPVPLKSGIPEDPDAEDKCDEGHKQTITKGKGCFCSTFTDCLFLKTHKAVTSPNDVTQLTSAEAGDVHPDHAVLAHVREHDPRPGG